MSLNPYAVPAREVMKACWPDRLQELLLKAALFPLSEAAPAWKAWLAEADIENIDIESSRLLPMVYLRLAPADNAALPRRVLSGIYRHHWCKNQLLLKAGADVLSRLQQAGIPVMVLKGAAMIALYYRDPGVRPIADFDLMVPTDRAAEALELLKKDGWRSHLGSPLDILMMFTHGEQLYSSSQRQIDLHWNLTTYSRAPGADRGFWEKAVPCNLSGVRALALHPAHQLFHIIIHGTSGKTALNIRWIADAMTLLEQEGPAMDWDCFSAAAVEHRLPLHMRDALIFLHNRFGAGVPAGVTRDLARASLTKADRRHYRSFCLPYLSSSQGPHGIGATIRSLWEGFKKNQWYVYYEDFEKTGPVRKAGRFLKYLVFMQNFKYGLRIKTRAGLFAHLFFHSFLRTRLLRLRARQAPHFRSA